jgi:hypothetical protein
MLRKVQYVWFLGYSAYGDFYGRESAKARRFDKLLQLSSFLQPLSVASNPEDWGVVSVVTPEFNPSCGSFFRSVAGQVYSSSRLKAHPG